MFSLQVPSSVSCNNGIFQSLPPSAAQKHLITSPLTSFLRAPKPTASLPKELGSPLHAPERSAPQSYWAHVSRAVTVISCGPHIAKEDLPTLLSVTSETPYSASLSHVGTAFIDDMTEAQRTLLLVSDIFGSKVYTLSILGWPEVWGFVSGACFPTVLFVNRKGGDVSSYQQPHSSRHSYGTPALTLENPSAAGLCWSYFQGPSSALTFRLQTSPCWAPGAWQAPDIPDDLTDWCSPDAFQPSRSHMGMNKPTFTQWGRQSLVLWALPTRKRGAVKWLWFSWLTLSWRSFVWLWSIWCLPFLSLSPLFLSNPYIPAERTVNT